MIRTAARHGQRRRDPAGSWNGMFTGQFYGAERQTWTPGAVTGEFNANFSNGSVAGGFGARKQ